LRFIDTHDEASAKLTKARIKILSGINTSADSAILQLFVILILIAHTAKNIFLDVYNCDILFVPSNKKD